MSASTKRALSLLLSSAFLVGALIIYAVFIRPEYETIFRLRGELVSKTNLLQKQQQVMTQVQNLIIQSKGAEKLSESLLLALPAEPDVASVLSQINALSQLSGLAVQSIGLSHLSIKSLSGKPSFAQGLGTLRLDLRLIGNYGGLKKFLQALETNIRLMDIKALRLEAASKSPTEDLFNYLLTVDTYYQTK